MIKSQLSFVSQWSSPFQGISSIDLLRLPNATQKMLVYLEKLDPGLEQDSLVLVNYGLFIESTSTCKQNGLDGKRINPFQLGFNKSDIVAAQTNARYDLLTNPKSDSGKIDITKYPTYTIFCTDTDIIKPNKHFPNNYYISTTLILIVAVSLALINAPFKYETLKQTIRKLLVKLSFKQK